MRKAKRNISSFNLSFLDIMFCGFGAVVLLVLIINSHIKTDNKIKYEDLTSAVEQVKNNTKAAQVYQQNLQNKLQEKFRASEELQRKIAKVSKTISELEGKIDLDNTQSLALKKHINRLQSDIKAMDKKNLDEENKIQEAIEESGDKVRQYEGEGNRQYLTGLKLGGKRVLILLDSSASMLDETIVNIIVKRNQSEQIKKSARKWQQASNSVRWIVANLPLSSQLMMVNFNTTATSMNKTKSLEWIKTNDKEKINSLFNHLSKLIPKNGTNLQNAFSSIHKMLKKPDNIILITDGLPTQGSKPGNKTKVSPSERIKLFEKAIKIIPKGIPVNTILLPMEGDPMAAALFWKLAIDTKGSFMTPSRDWP